MNTATLTSFTSSAGSRDSGHGDGKKKNSSLMDALFKQFEAPTLKLGDLVDGTVIENEGGYIFIDLGPAGTGVIYGREFIAARDAVRKMKRGDAIQAKVIELENEDGLIELSLSEARQDIIWKEARNLMDKKTPIELAVADANKGGLVINWKGVAGFLPTSQLKSSHYPRVEGGDKEKILSELKKLVGETLTLTVITANSKEGKLIFSEKSAESEEMKEAVSKYKVGDEIEGVVTGVVDFGIFIKLEEGLEGLAHISELDWSLVEDPSDHFSVGDNVKAKIIGIDGGKISLSVKALTPDPWTGIKDEYKKGDIVEGEVVKFNQYGSLVCLKKGICGLVHISEFSGEEDMKNKLELGKKYPFQIALLEPEEHRLTFSFLREGEASAVGAENAPASATSTPSTPEPIPQEAENKDSSQPDL